MGASYFQRIVDSCVVSLAAAEKETCLSVARSQESMGIDPVSPSFYSEVIDRYQIHRRLVKMAFCLGVGFPFPRLQ